MLRQTRREELAQAANDMANNSEMLWYQNTLYIPADYETLDVTHPPDPARRVWLPVSVTELTQMINDRQGLLLRSDAERRSYYFMVEQCATTVHEASPHLLLRTPDGLRELQDDGQLHESSQRFTPYFIPTPLNTDTKKQTELLAIMLDWLGDMEEVESLLAHLATVLAPHWSATRYVLLIGSGRNGKSVLLEMLRQLFGSRNVSHVSREAMSGKKPECLELSNKMLNTVADGSATYLKDSGPEKAFTAGDPVSIHKLYQSEPVLVQTNALFIEGLNQEPRSGDKSMALQKRLVRFAMDKTYPEDEVFKRYMLSQEMLGALLALLVERYVRMEDVYARLRPTKKSLSLRMEQLLLNDVALQFLIHHVQDDPLGRDGLIGSTIDDLVPAFTHWRISENNDISSWETVNVKRLLRPLFLTKEKTVRHARGPRKEREITGFTEETSQFLDHHLPTSRSAHAVRDNAVVDE